MTLLVHGTAVAVGGDAVLLRGPSGSGKSDLALRLIFGSFPRWPQPLLVADDQSILTPAADGKSLHVSCPSAIAGKIEVRGLGIIDVPCVPIALLHLVIDLVPPGQVERLPPRSPDVRLAGIAVAHLALTPFEASAPLKALLALERLRKA